MRVLVACEFSGVVREAFLARGHDAYSCDILPSNFKRANPPSRHIQQDVTPLLREEWDLVIAHPPCTYLCNSGVRWLHKRPERMMDLCDGAQFFLECLAANADRVCVENPIMHKYATQRIKVKPTQIVQPWMFGHGEAKATCLWLKNLTPLEPTNVVAGRKPKMHYLSGPRVKRQLLRSLTYQGVADAMAEQWG